MSIYKPCDIRGNAATELTPELYRRWGRVLGSSISPGEKFVAGGDVRGSTPRFLAALLAGLAEMGVDAVDLGVLPTPMVYYARRRLAAAGCAVVTASHNPPEINGLKWTLGNRPPTEQQIRQLQQDVSPDARLSSDHPACKPRPLDVSFDYVGQLQEIWMDWLDAKLHVVLDPMHGCFARLARRYLQAIFPQCLFSTIHDEPLASFGGRNPDCSRPQHLEELCSAVYHHRAHVGLAFDGDGDRLAVVDNRGTSLTAEEATWVLLQTFGDDLTGQPFVYDQKFSDRVPEAARQLGAEPMVQRSGHAFVRTRMLDSDALFGAEISGHYFFRATDGCDDALFAACRLIAHLARCDEPLGDLRRRCPPVFITSDLRVPVEPDRQEAVLQRVRSAWSANVRPTIDGVRIDFADGWALVRRSVTEPALTFRFEASNATGLRELVWSFCDAVPEVGNDLLDAYGASVG
ncbi:MAG: hypothetical protein HQ567_26825 [Candidatus Nealsonbacteria bacterium]|nr:hypothetical protein [Candidatus Nealsonbacteria bacterium]